MLSEVGSFFWITPEEFKANLFSRLSTAQFDCVGSDSDPSIKEISGEQFADNLFEQITSLGADFEVEKAVNIEKLPDGTFKVKTEYNEYASKSVIIAAGVKHKHLRTKSDREDLVGKGVYYCAICDGAFYKDKEVAADAQMRYLESVLKYSRSISPSSAPSS